MKALVGLPTSKQETECFNIVCLCFYVSRIIEVSRWSATNGGSLYNLNIPRLIANTTNPATVFAPAFSMMRSL